MQFIRSDEVEAIRSRIDHPIIDSDGHQIEYLPLVRDFMVEDAGEDVARLLDQMTQSAAARAAVPSPADRRRLGMFSAGVWGLPAKNTLDRATVMLPDLMYRRLDEIGIDFSVVYPTYGLMTGVPNDELRCALARALNRYNAELYAGYRDRLEPVAAIPIHTPEEAIAELDHAVVELGLKAIMFMGIVPRLYEGGSGPGRWLDTLGHDSLYDYDPVWRRCQELGVAPTFHSGGQGWGTRNSTINNSFNQVGNFAAADEGLCRSLVFGGVPMRFPEVHFAFQEGGVAWAAALLAGIISHWEKRNINAIQQYDPAALDRDLLRQMFIEYGTADVASRVDRLADGIELLSSTRDLPRDVDQFGESLLTGVEDLLDMFANRFYFGCEADDPMNVLAFASNLNPGGITLPAIFASDVGHWDVPDLRGVVPEAYELVEHGHIDEEQFRDFVFDNPVRLWTAMNPEFFRDTILEKQAAPVS
jgi:predicted TIM-barrel fold metal-dependent hydrolase